MQRIRCYECGRSYDYDEDAFCPKCGAFNQPPRRATIGADGSVIRVDGLNERNHQNSFVHAELHEENRERRGTALSKGIKRTARPAAARVTQAADSRGKKSKGKPLNIFTWIIFAIIVINMLAKVLTLLF